MTELELVQNEIAVLVKEWELRLSGIDMNILHNRKNTQNRTIKQILGHMIDSASNNLHRTVHLQYQTSPLQFPDYANLGANDKWIAVQNYQEEEWGVLIQLWKYSNLHLVHVIGNIVQETLGNVWISALGEHITLNDMIVDYPRHLKLHLGEIEELLRNRNECNQGTENRGCSRATAGADTQQVAFYMAKLSYEIDSWDMAELVKSDPSVVVLDTRSREAYGAEHIRGAVSFPHKTITHESTRKLDPSKTYITYCDGIGCNASTKGALNLAQLGFTTRELLGGLAWWKRDGYQTDGTGQILVEVATCGCS